MTRARDEADGGASRTFSRRHRLSGASAFARVFAGRLRKERWPLVVWVRSNGLSEPRLGLSISRAVGTAVTRNRLKRRLREAFRTLRRELPRGKGGAYDLVVGARAHEDLDLPEYRRLMHEAVEALHRVSEKREA